VLHTLRCIGFASEDRIATTADMAPAELAARLHSLTAAGLLDHHPGPFGGWGLTDLGRTTVEERVAAELAATGAGQAVRTAYAAFLQLNPILLEVCDAWQVRKIGGTRLLNDHADADYDAAVLTRLMRLHEEALPICADLGSRLTRFAAYGPRLSTALDRALAGDASFVTESMDSYHTVWFQLHEDLLATTGISREEERQRKT
jgi:hypothetical protein